HQHRPTTRRSGPGDFKENHKVITNHQLPNHQLPNYQLLNYQSSSNHPMPYDLFSRTFKANPFPTFELLREERPIYAHTAPNGLTIWYISRYEDVVAVLKDPQRFVKDQSHVFPDKRGTQSQHDDILRLINQNMLFSDPPDHTRLRALVSQAFTPRRVEQMAGRITAVANDLIDKMAGQETIELIDAFAFPLPVMVIMELLGVPTADAEQVRDWSKAIIAPGSHGVGYRKRKKMLRAFADYLKIMFATRRQATQDDLISALVQAEEAGDHLTEEELSSMVVLLLVTGHETVVNMIGNSVLALLQNPNQLSWLMANPDRFDQAIEELLRYDGPVETSTTRWAAEDVIIGGHTIRQGDVIRVVTASANRDPAVFDNPDTLDLTRQNNPHLAFGRGIHYCLGAPLARLEGRIALETLFGRFPNLHLAQPVEQITWRSGVLLRGPKALYLSP
ncbi:MAG: cytochrome P450, partial [Candidatus Promineifilaceae bacterium]